MLTIKKTETKKPPIRWLLWIKTGVTFFRLLRSYELHKPRNWSKRLPLLVLNRSRFLLQRTNSEKTSPDPSNSLLEPSGSVKIALSEDHGRGIIEISWHVVKRVKNIEKCLGI
jgi:hypothetical protein